MRQVLVGISFWGNVGVLNMSGLFAGETHTHGLVTWIPMDSKVRAEFMLGS
jgi:hypothetical protein